MAKIPVVLQDILRAQSRVKRFVHRTPVFTNSTFDDRYGRRFYFKGENLQKTGSFKVRGALNAVSTKYSFTVLSTTCSMVRNMKLFCHIPER